MNDDPEDSVESVESAMEIASAAYGIRKEDWTLPDDL